MTLQPLRPYQAEAISAARAAYRAGKRSILMVAPTGAGKTRIGVELVTTALSKPGADGVLWLAHREELLRQARDRLLAEGLPRVGLIASGERLTNAPVQVASVQTLVARKARGLPPARVVVLDEAHHYAAEEWGEVAAAYKDSAKLGLTATPERGDGRPLGDLFDHVVPVSSVRELMELGVLVPCATHRPAGATKDLSQDPVAFYLAHGAGERCFCFCVNVKHAEHVAATFRANGVPAATIHADTPWLLRRARLEAFRRQSPRPLHEAGVMEDAPIVLCNVYTLTEGVDVPEASVCILARGCGSTGMFLQMVGRVLRSAPGKTRAILGDLRGVSHKHLLPESDRIWSLEGKAIDATKEEKDRQMLTCIHCGATFGAWAVDAAGVRVCPGCRKGAPELEPPKVSLRQLHVAGSGAAPEEKERALEELAQTAVAREYKPGWVAHRYRERFGDWPARVAAQKAFEFALGGRRSEVA